MSRQKIIIDTVVQGLEAIEKLSKEIDDLRKISDSASKEIDDLKDQIKKTSKVADKGGVEIEGLAEKFTKMGGAGGRAGGALESLGVVMSGPLGLAIGGAVIATGGLIIAFKTLTTGVDLTLDAVKRYVAGNERLTKSSSVVISKMDEMIETFGAAVVGGEGFADMLAFVGREFDKMTKWIKDNAKEIFETTKTIADGLITFVQIVVGIIGTIAAAIVSPFDLALTAIQKFRTKGLEAMLSIFEKLGPFLVKVGAITQKTLNENIATTKSAIAGIGDYTMEMGAKIFQITKRIKELGDRTKKTLGGMTLGPLGVGTGKPAPGGGGRPTTPAEDEGPRFVGDPWAADKPTARLYRPSFQEGDIGAVEMMKLDNEAQKADMSITKVNDSLSQTEVIATATATILDSMLVKTITMVAEIMLDMAEATAQAMGGFLVGVGNLSDFRDSILDMLGSLSSEMGSFFIRTGIGMAFLNPGAGAGLIASGLALQVLSGALSGHGSGNKGTGGKSSAGAGGGTSSAVTREIQRSLRGPDAGGRVTNIEVVIAGRAIEPEMITILDDITRLRRSRAFSRRV